MNNDALKRLGLVISALTVIGGFFGFIYPNLFLTADEVAWVRNVRTNGLSFSEEERLNFIRWRENVTYEVKTLQVQVEEINRKLDAWREGGMIQTPKEKRQLVIDVIQELERQGVLK